MIYWKKHDLLLLQPNTAWKETLQSVKTFRYLNIFNIYWNFFHFKEVHTKKQLLFSMQLALKGVYRKGNKNLCFCFQKNK